MNNDQSSYSETYFVGWEKYVGDSTEKIQIFKVRKY